MTTKTGIIYLQRDKFEIYSPYLPNIIEFRFVPEIVRDFDLINRELLENLIKVFLANNKIPPSGLVVVVADSASFIKDFVSPLTPPPTAPGQPPTPPPTLEDLHNQANKYLEHIPFEQVASKVFPLAAGVRAYATNQELYEGLKSILEKQGFIIQSVLPGFVFGPNLSNRPNIDGASIAAILQKVNTVQGYNLLKEVVAMPEPAVPGEKTEGGEAEAPGEKDTTTGEEESVLNKPENKKVMMAVVISAIALIVIITGVVIYSQFNERPYKPPPAVAPQASAPTAVPQVIPATITEAKDLTAQITSSTTSASTAASLRTALAAYGFKSVVPVIQEGLGATQSFLIFSPKVSQQVRAVVTETVKKSIPTVLVQDKVDATVDITVILGK